MSKVINIGFDTKSIRQAIKEIENIRRKFSNIIPQAYLSKCADYVISRANEYLSNYNIDGEITADIQTHWSKEMPTSNTIKVINDSDKAVFIEFGVGRVGSISSHPNASESGYQYNLPSNAKSVNGTWAFDVRDKNGIDLVKGYYKHRRDAVVTSGSPANMYLYNATLDLISSGAYKRLWLQTLDENL